ncbi:DNA/RNA non-specific endonuclease [Azospirillum sp. B2RO_4]|uniref:DNA/RNA non-specific endonuclease n=1 Tax=Azospirillum sp. B2RO_4 TaxID=3027796 RepID=UPI003DA829ED
MAERNQKRVRDFLVQIAGGRDQLGDLPRQVAATTEAIFGTGHRTAGRLATEATAPPPPVVPPAGAKVIPDGRLAAAALSAAEKLRGGNKPLTPIEQFATEAIIIPDRRPAFDIVDGDFAADHWLWGKLTRDLAIHRRLISAFPCIGRIELPGQSRIPYGGTGFVVGPGLLMTNRHVADIFAQGVGVQNLRFRTGMQAGVDFRQERGRPRGLTLAVRSVRMIHPWWDMALLEVEGLAAAAGSLRLSVEDARGMEAREVAVVGYPAYDPLRNDPAVQDKLFDRTYGVKRLQPGQIAARRQTESFAKIVDAAAHDCSTLGGNSGSAVIDLATGEVVALHFGGRYLDINVAVPTAELVRDARVRDAGVAFAGSAPRGPAPEWLNAWNETEVSMNDDRRPPALPATDHGIVPCSAGRATFEVPLRITVEIGDGARVVAPAVSAPTAREAGGADAQEALREPERDTNYAGRRGYDPFFLNGREVPLPKARDPRLLATLRDGGTELTYQNFSILMHAERRLALITAANVTREPHLRTPEPGRPTTRKGLSGLGKNDQEKWFLDPRLDAAYQLVDAFYTRDGGAFDKGHIVRREDVAWGETYATLKRANGDTYHITNCSPQVAQFNRSTLGEDNWGDLEDLVLAEAASERFCLFAGPILAPEDRPFEGQGEGRQALRVQIPSRYWKVVVARTADGLAAYGFVLEQDLSDVPLEFTAPENFRRLMAPLTAIEDAAGVDFGSLVRAADRFATDQAEALAFRGGVRRTESLAPAAVDQAPQSGDDIEAEPGVNRTVRLAEAPASWRVAKSLLVLREQVNAQAPDRNKGSDGTIGDAAHASRNSDHNPWVTDGAAGVVTAMDITHDPRGGCDAGALAAAIVASKDDRVKYVIWDRRIANHATIDGQPAWAWRPYTGANPHNKHVHISVLSEKVQYDNEKEWQL